MNEKNLVIEIDSEVTNWFDKVEEQIKNEPNSFKIKVDFRKLEHNNYTNDNDFTAPFGEEYFPDGVYEALPKSNDNDERKLFKEYWSWSPFFAFDQLLSRYEQLEEVTIEQRYSWRGNAVSMKKRVGDEPWLNINKFSCACGTKPESIKDIPFFIKDITTLTEFQFPNLRDQSLTEIIVENNPNIETFSCRWDFVSKEVLSKPYKNFLVDEKYRKKYEKLNEDLKEIDDDEKYVLFRLFLLEHEPDFKPKVETLLGFLKCSLAPVRLQALNVFHTYYSDASIENIDGLNICLSGATQAYKLAQIKEKLAEKNVKVTTKITDKTELLVVGLKHKLEELPADISTISAIALEEFMNQLENRTLSNNDNEAIAEKIQNLLFSDYDTNVLLAMTLMEEGGIPKDVFEALAGFFKVHPTKKVREKAKELIIRHGGEKGESFLAICEKRNYISMGDDEKPKKDLLALEEVEGFNVELFAYVLVIKQDIAKFYLVTKESEWAKKAIVEKINGHRYWHNIKGKASSHFKLANKINTIYTDCYSNVFEEMTWLKELSIENKKETIILSAETLSNLKHLKSLSIEAKHIILEGSVSTIEIKLIASSVTVLGRLEAKHNLNIETKELEATSLTCMNELILSRINKINTNVEVLGTPVNLVIESCNFSQEIYRKLFVRSLEKIKIEVNKKITLDSSVKELNLKSMEILANSIVIEEGASFLSDKVILETKKIVCKKEWKHQINFLEVPYGDFLERLVNDNLETLSIRYDFSYDYYDGSKIDFKIPSFLAHNPHLKCLKLEDYNGSEKKITFESNEPLNIKELHLKNLKLVLDEKMPTPKLEVLGLDDMILDKKTKQYVMLPTIKKIVFSKYEAKFNLDVSKLNELYELELSMATIENKVYSIKKLTIAYTEIENFKAENFPNVEIFNEKYGDSESFSGLIGFKKLRRLETMVSEYTNSNLTDIEKLERLEELKLYDNYVSYGRHDRFTLPLFVKPLKIKILELEKLNISISDSQHQYFSDLEELVLDDVLVSDFSVFNMPSLKRVRVVNPPSVNAPKNWLEALKETFKTVEVVVE